MTLQQHKERVHEYDTSNSIYPCNKCNFPGTSLISLNIHDKNIHQEILYQPRTKQNFKEINFDEDSDDNSEWSPDKYDKELLIEDTINDKSKKRKQSQLELIPNKIAKTSIVCEKCLKTFSRLDNLKRHVRKNCKK